MNMLTWSSMLVKTDYSNLCTSLRTSGGNPVDSNVMNGAGMSSPWKNQRTFQNQQSIYSNLTDTLNQ